MPQLLVLLEDKNGDRQAKISVITALGDLCMHSGEKFVSYLEQVKGPLARAICAAAKSSQGLSEEQLQYYNDLRGALSECLTSMLFGLGENAKSLAMLLPSTLRMLIASVQVEAKPTAETFKGVAMLMGDLLSFFRNNAREHVDHGAMQGVVTTLLQTQDTECIEAAQFLKESMSKV